MRTLDVVIASGEVRLAGSLSLPQSEERCPIVLCIHGTGPLDRNENMPAQRLDVFNAFADRLARSGVAVLRYDKRGCGASTGDYPTAGQSELLDDAAACILMLETGYKDRFSALYLLGHSEGTLLAARLAARRHVQGLILLAPFLQRVEPLLIAQAHVIEAMLRETKGLAGLLNRALMKAVGRPSVGQRKLIDRIKGSSTPSFRHGGRVIAAKSLRELIELDPEAIYRNVQCRTLLISGAKDLQCDPADAGRIAALIGPGATSVVLPDLTHVLRRDTGAHTFRSYPALLQHPIDAEVLDIVGAWLKGMYRAP